MLLSRKAEASRMSSRVSGCLGSRTSGRMSSRVCSKSVLISLAVVVLMAGLVFFASCAPRAQETGGSAQGEQDQAQAAVWSPQSDCVTCHTNEAESLSNTAALAAKHIATANCVSCHTEVSVLEKVHDGVTAPSTAKKLRKSEVSSEACTTLGCHANASERIGATAALTSLTDSEGLRVNPHDLPATAGHELVTCATCHTGHAAAAEAKKTCLKCHHQDVFACHTCHD